MMFKLHRLKLQSGLMGGALLVAFLGAISPGCSSNEAEPEADSGGEGGQDGEDGEPDDGDQGEQGGSGGDENPGDGAGGVGGSSGGSAGSGAGSGGSAGAGGGGSSGAAGKPGGAGMGGAPVGAAGTSGTGGCQTNKVCDDFESYPVGMFKSANGWSLKGGGVAVDESKAFSGKRSIKISVAGTGAGNQGMLGTTNKTVLSTGKSVYARMMVFLDQVPTGESGLHWAFMRAMGSHSQGGKTAILSHSIGGQPRTLRNLLLWPTGSGTQGLQDCFNDDSEAIPTNRWVCLEWHLDPVTQTMEVWFDGKKKETNSWMTRPPGGFCAMDQTEGKWVIPKLAIMDFGYQGYRNGTGGNIWIDDIALDTARINCPTK